MKKLHVIYITGLGDRGPNPQGQRTLVSWWRIYGVEPEFFQVNWGDKQPWEPKLKKLLSSVDEAHAAGKQVCLIGASAGASAAINAYAARKDKITGVVLIAGKVNRPETIGESYARKNPSFITSIQDCQAALASLDPPDLKRVMSRYALFDETVYKPDSYIPGARNKRIFSFGHFLTIAGQITLGMPFIIHFLRQQQR